MTSLPEGTFTGFLDKNRKEIRVGDVVRYQTDEFARNIHGEWSESLIVHRNGSWIMDYLRSKKGPVLPRGYLAGELSKRVEFPSKHRFFEQNDSHRTTNVEVIASE